MCLGRLLVDRGKLLYYPLFHACMFGFLTFIAKKIRWQIVWQTMVLVMFKVHWWDFCPPCAIAASIHKLSWFSNFNFS